MNSPLAFLRRRPAPLAGVFVALAVLSFPVARLELRAAEDPETPEEVDSPAQLLRQGFYADAIDGFRQTLETIPGDAAAARGLAEALVATGKYGEAFDALKKTPGFKESADLLSMAGRIRLYTGDLAAAEGYFRLALEVDADHPEGLNRLGEALSKQGKNEDAAVYWNKIVSLYERLTFDDVEEMPAAAFVEMGLALIGLNRYAEANSVMFAEAVDKDPKNPNVLAEHGKLFLEKYDFQNAPMTLREALDENPYHADARVAMADYLLTDFQKGTRRFDLAEKEIERALKTHPNHAGAYTQRGRLWLTDGNLPRAIEDFEKALEINPSRLDTRGMLAAAHLLSQDAEAFARHEKAALAVNPRAAKFYHTVAQAIETRFRYAEALEMSEKALALDPDYWPAFHTLGINCLRAGDEERGRRFLEKSFKHDNYNVWVLNTLRLLRYMDRNHRELKTEHFIFKFPKADYEVLKLFLAPLLEDAYERLSRHYKTELKPPIHIDVYSKHQWFSARIVGLGGFPASGACFGNVVALTTPKALPQNWGAVAWHEFAHVVTLHLTHNRVPRWLTEGLSVYEEGRDHPHWTRLFEREIAEAFAAGRLLPIEELDFGFSKPKYPGQVLMSYYQGCLIVQYITERWNFDKVLDILAGYDAGKTTPAIFSEVLELDLDAFNKGFFEFLARWVEKTGYQPGLAAEKIPMLQIAVEEKPDDVQALVDLAWAYLTSGNTIDAPLTAAKALKLDPDNADALAIRGFAYLTEGKTAKAAADFENALEKGSRFRYRLHESLGRMALKEKDTDAAIRHLEAAKKVSPRAGAGYPPGNNLYYQLAELYNRKGDDEMAVKQYEELRAFAVEDLECRMKLANHYLVADTDESVAKALEVLEEAIYINPFDRSIHENIARAAVRLEKHEITVRQYEYLLTFPDTNPQVAYLALARAHLGLGKSEEAAGYARKVLAIDGDHKEARELLEKANRK